MRTVESRIVRMLRRHQERKSLPDFDAVCVAADRGYITMTGPSDDIEIKITDKGKKLLERKP